RTVTLGLEAHSIDAGVHLGNAEDLVDLARRFALVEIDGLAPEASGLCQPVGVHVTDDDDRRAEKLRADGCGEADGSGAGDVDRRSWPDTGADGAVESGGEDVAEHGQVTDLLHRP